MSSALFCPRCGERVAAGGLTCALCGTSPLPRRRRQRRVSEAWVQRPSRAIRSVLMSLSRLSQ